MVYGIWLLVLGVLAVPSLVAKKPSARALVAKVAPFQGWIGAVSFVGGIWWLIYSVLHLDWIKGLPRVWFPLAATAVLLTALGLILGIGILKSFLKAPSVQAKLDQTLTKLKPYQGTLGIAAIAVGVWSIVVDLFRR